MLNRHFQEFIELLEKHGVKYLVVGGYAVGFHGFPRYTGDLDVFIAISETNSENILKVFDEFGFSELGLSAQDFLEEEIVVEIGREPIKIQILTGIDGVTFEESYSGKEYLQLSKELKVPFIGYEALLKNKKASPRAKDKIDFEELKRIKG
ncbi:MAG: nucleotidyltransferase [Allomuricauda sp.]